MINIFGVLASMESDLRASSNGSRIWRQNLCRFMYTFSMTRTPTYSLSVSDATKRGIAGLARDAESGSSITVERNHRPVAAIIGVSELYRYQEAERDLRDLAVVLIRTATDNGERTSLDDVFSRFGFDRATLEREVDEDLAAGRE
jgi:antitoxin (DNA-binding transcriptional repressor) of toxin-antitoxin stability system